MRVPLRRLEYYWLLLFIYHHTDDHIISVFSVNDCCFNSPVLVDTENKLFIWNRMIHKLSKIIYRVLTLLKLHNNTGEMGTIEVPIHAQNTAFTC